MKLFDRLIDHVVDRVMARAKHNRPTFTVTNIHNIANRAAADFCEGVAGGPAVKIEAAQAMQHPGRTA